MGARAAARLPWIATIATDTPFFPRDLVARLLAAVEVEGAELACAASGGRAHPVFGLWPVRLADELRRAMVDEEIRKVDVWTARYRLAVVEFPAEPVDPFFNTNRPEDLAEAERLLAPGTDPRRSTLRLAPADAAVVCGLSAVDLGLCRLEPSSISRTACPSEVASRSAPVAAQQLLASLRRRAWRSTGRP